jgi:hypothetical protein
MPVACLKSRLWRIALSGAGVRSLDVSLCLAGVRLKREAEKAFLRGDDSGNYPTARKIVKSKIQQGYRLRGQ